MPRSFRIDAILEIILYKIRDNIFGFLLSIIIKFISFNNQILFLHFEIIAEMPGINWDD